MHGRKIVLPMEIKTRTHRGSKQHSLTKFGELVRQARIDANLSLKELAEGIGVSTPYLWKIEAGKIKEPSGAVVVRLARAFGWTMNYLENLFESEEEKQIDAQIESEEMKLPENLKQLIRAKQEFLNSLKGKKIYLAFLQQLNK